MKVFALFLLVGLCGTELPSNDTGVQIYKTEVNYKRIYETRHNVIKILVPLNSVNHRFFVLYTFQQLYSNQFEKMPTFFFVKANITAKGKKLYRGLFVVKDNKVKKLLNTGKDMSASVDDSKNVFLAASDGIYVYDSDKNGAEKYGSINEDIIGIEKEKFGDVLYILTAKKEVYKVTDNGYAKEKIKNIFNAEQIALDYSNNIYFCGSDKAMYVRNMGGVMAISGLPENITNIVMLRTPYNIIYDKGSGIFGLLDHQFYYIYANGTSEYINVFDMQRSIPSALSMELFGLTHIAYYNKIYVLNQFKELVEGMDDVNNRSTYEEIKDSYENFRLRKSIIHI